MVHSFTNIPAYNWYASQIHAKEAIYGLPRLELVEGVVRVMPGELKCRHVVFINDGIGGVNLTKTCSNVSTSTTNLRKHVGKVHRVDVKAAPGGGHSQDSLKEAGAFYDDIKVRNQAHNKYQEDIGRQLRVLDTKRTLAETAFEREEQEIEAKRARHM